MIDNKYIYNSGALTVNIEFMWRGLETGERRAFSESFQLFRAEPYKLYIYRQYTNIVFILQYNLQNFFLFNLIIKKKDNGNPIDTSIVVPSKA
jgi:hypothetical protein